MVCGFSLESHWGYSMASRCRSDSSGFLQDMFGTKTTETILRGLNTFARVSAIVTNKVTFVNSYLLA